jgi:hypothetical protein
MTLRTGRIGKNGEAEGVAGLDDAVVLAGSIDEPGPR